MLIISDLMQAVDEFSQEHPYTFLFLFLAAMAALSLIFHYIGYKLRPYVFKERDDNDD
jgi:hypothetical protein